VIRRARVSALFELSGNQRIKRTLRRLPEGMKSHQAILTCFNSLQRPSWFVNGCKFNLILMR